MPETQPNRVARVIAVLALVGAFLLVVVTIATSGGGSDGGGSSGSDEDEDTSGITAKGERALENGVWVVGEGDTLNQLAAETGFSEDELLQLNPDIDPQILTTGQRISLRSGTAGDADDTTAADDPTPSAAEAGGSGEGDDGPTGTTTTTPGSGISDGITD